MFSARSSLLRLAVAAACLAAVYAATFDGVDVPDILKDEQAVAPYVKCLMGTGECNESGDRLKAIVPNALLEKCSKCTDSQKSTIAKIAAAMKQNYSEDWNKLLEMIDPKKEHRSYIDAIIKSIPTL